MVNFMICGCEICRPNVVFFCRKCYRTQALKKKWITKYDFIKYIRTSFRIPVNENLGTRQLYLLLKIRYPNIYPLNQIFEKLLFLKLFT